MRRLLQFLLPALLALAACSEVRDGPGMVSQRIGEVVRDPGAREVDLSKLTTFGWQYFVYFPAGTPREELCKFINAVHKGCGRIIRYAAVPQGHLVLLFGLNGQLTHAELHDVANGEFDFATGRTGLPRERAVFRIHRTAVGIGSDRAVLELK